MIPLRIKPQPEKARISPAPSIGINPLSCLALENVRAQDQELARRACQGLEQRFAQIKTRGHEIDEREYRNRLDYELVVINQFGLSGYLLVVAEIIGWAKDRGIPVGPGRGTAVGSLVCYALRITRLDPIQYGLLFDRFLNPEKSLFSSIGADFCFRRYREFLRYAAEKCSARSGMRFDTQEGQHVGQVSFDPMPSRDLTVIHDAVMNIRARLDPEFDIRRIPMDDQATFDLLSRGDTKGVFECESPGARWLLRRLRPSSFEDVVALVALYRPGLLESVMVDDFVKRKHGQTEVTYPLPQLAPILKETYGVIVYQEQVMQTAQELAGYSLGEGDILRRAMGKRIPELRAQKKRQFMLGCAEREIDLKMAARLFDLIEYYAGYAFNKSHAAAYAMIAYQTAYLKANHPREFEAASSRR
jgi:DNA polymerase III alpha subunit